MTSMPKEYKALDTGEIVINGDYYSPAYDTIPDPNITKIRVYRAEIVEEVIRGLLNKDEQESN